MHQKRRPARYRRFDRRPRFESLERRLVMSFTVIDPIFSTSQDKFVVAQDSESNQFEILSSDCETSSCSGFGISNVTEPQLGAVEIQENGILSYTPDADVTGIDRFEVTLVSTQGDTRTVPVFVNIVRPFVAIEDWFHLLPNSELSSLEVLENDRSNAALLNRPELSIVEITSASHGVVEISEDGKSLLYRPEVGFQGLDEFTYIASDAAGHESEASVRIRLADADENDWVDKREQSLLEQALTKHEASFGAPKSSYSYYGCGNSWLAFCEVRLLLSFDDAMLFSASSTGDNNASTTNVQVAGVDEGDIVKADGDYLYVLSNRTEEQREYQQLIVVDTHDPTQPVVLSRVDFDGQVLELYLFGDKLFVISSDGVTGDSSTEAEFTDDFVVTTFDVSDHAQPAVVDETVIEGNYFNSRSIGEFVYVVSDMAALTDLLPPIETTCSFENSVCFYETVEAYLTRARSEITELAQDNGAPEFVTYAADGSVLRSGILSDDPLFNPEANENQSGLMTTTVASFEFSGGGPKSGVSLVAPRTTELYVSSESLYLAANTWSIENGSYSNIFRIQKMDLLADGEVQWAADGSAAGSLKNQFSLDEHEGYLRVTSSTGSTNQLSVFEQQDDKLIVVGKIDSIAPGEQIYATRFSGDTGFLVTFRKVDPLFAMDLSDPHNPRVLGELKIPGYSTYLQLLDDTHLLGIGRNADENSGLFQEMQVSLFDISDLTSPQLLHQYSFSGGRNTWSPLLADAWNLGEHHALSYFADHQTLAIPIYSGDGNGWSWAYGGAATENFVRLLKFDLENGITSLGDVAFDGDFDARAARTVLVNDSLYAIAPDMIRVVNVADPADEQAVVYIGRGATDDQAITRADMAISIPLTANDDLEGNGESVNIVSTGETEQGGTVTVAPDGRSVAYVPPKRFVGKDSFTYQLQLENGSRSMAHVKVDVKRTWHNSINRHDTDGDGVASPLDLLVAFNFIRRHRAGAVEEVERSIVASTEAGADATDVYLDVDNDGSISPLDCITLINHLNQQRRNAAVVEQAASASNVAALDAVLADEEDELDELLTAGSGVED